ncbi:hypothetical protein Xind_03096 [Xenorhabdus indica]|nr:hypothetical protein [Xenorhabdus indica]
MHYLLLIRTAVLNDNLKTQFKHWYAGIKLGEETKHYWMEAVAVQMPQVLLCSYYTS